MQKEMLTIRAPGVLNIPAGDVLTLLDAGNGDAALLYLHILQNGGVLDPERAATDLHRSDREIEITAGRLRKMGVLLPGGAEAPFPEPAPKRPRAASRRSMEDEAFRRLVDTVQADLGRTLSGPDLGRLFGIYDELSFSPDAIVVLVNFCKWQYEARRGSGRTVSFGYIEKEAYAWARREIVTAEDAERWSEQLRERESLLGQVRREFGIRDRDFSKTEREYVEKWLEMGFPVESIAIAQDRTIVNTHGLSWKYMDKILVSWHGMGLHTPEEIEKNDPRDGRKKRASSGAPASAQDDSKTLEQLARIREKMKQS